MSDGNGKRVDPMVRWIDEENRKQHFRGIVHGLTDTCWDTCMPDRSAAKLDEKSETCLKNCVNRLFDASEFLLQIGRHTIDAVQDKER